MKWERANRESAVRAQTADNRAEIAHANARLACDPVVSGPQMLPPEHRHKWAPDPRSVVCPECAAALGLPCVGDGFGKRNHDARIKASKVAYSAREKGGV